MIPEAIIGFLINTLRFIILLGVLVFVHELGHFLAAKFSNIYVVRLSLGFGKRLAGFKWGETDYCISAIPLGGYVKMVGQEDTPTTQAEAEHANPEIRDVPPERRFDTQPTMKKLAVGFAGPVMNLLFAVPVLWVAFLIGVNVPAFSQQTYIGAVTPGSPAEKAGIHPGERVLSINGQPVENWEDVQLKILTNQDSPLHIKLEDFSGNINNVTVTPQRTADSSRATIGVDPLLAVAVGRILPGLPAAQSGLQENDVILTYNDNPPTNENMGSDSLQMASKLIDSVNAHAGKPMTFTVLRNNKILRITVTPKDRTVIKGLETTDGLITFVDKAELGSKASSFQPGDTVVAVNDQPVQQGNVDELLNGVAPGQTVSLTIRHEAGFFEQPREMTVRLPVARHGMIGVIFTPDVVKQFGPTPAFLKSFDAYGNFVGLTMKTLYYLLTGKVSTREMAGPIGIAFLTTQSLKLGLGYYLNLVALITINLGIINLLPIPILDGGLILISLIQSIRRKPLEEKYLILLQRIGLAFILFLVLVATYNDILRVINYLLGRGFME